MTIHSVKRFAFGASDAHREVDFHERILGLRCVRRDSTTLWGNPGEVVAFGLDGGAAEALLVAYCLGAEGPRGRLGTEMPKAVNLGIPVGSLAAWRTRLYDAHVDTAEVLFLLPRLAFAGPSGVRYTLTEMPQPDDEDGSPDSNTTRIVGLYSVTLSVIDVREIHDFIVHLLGGEHLGQDMEVGRYRFEDKSGGGIELLAEPYRVPGSWTYGVGIAHHIVLDAGAPSDFDPLRQRLVEAGYSGISTEADDSGTSHWLRMPSGTLIDLRCGRAA
ncbi:hypothetical protein DC31_04330 [Microbacterium sp. CH12i]|uniref:hypothetical protein n=1 Tax=Microbacterium sp. CH12i TaxID=1479651 RepID=UPI00046192EE|nr:hypothetical protein [Microbacterium sp. CH12i]KDA04872.1 hypothetical protein DC31_04330 [Microbacterium sp. CH12i]